MTEYNIVGWHHRLNGHEFEQALGDDEGQCCSPWSAAVHDVVISRAGGDFICIFTAWNQGRQ